MKKCIVFAAGALALATLSAAPGPGRPGGGAPQRAPQRQHGHAPPQKPHAHGGPAVRGPAVHHPTHGKGHPHPKYRRPANARFWRRPPAPPPPRHGARGKWRWVATTWDSVVNGVAYYGDGYYYDGYNYYYNGAYHLSPPAIVTTQPVVVTQPAVVAQPVVVTQPAVVTQPVVVTPPPPPPPPRRGGLLRLLLGD